MGELKLTTCCDCVDWAGSSTSELSTASAVVALLALMLEETFTGETTEAETGVVDDIAGVDKIAGVDAGVDDGVDTETETAGSEVTLEVDWVTAVMTGGATEGVTVGREEVEGAGVVCVADSLMTVIFLLELVLLSLCIWTVTRCSWSAPSSGELTTTTPPVFSPGLWRAKFSSSS